MGTLSNEEALKSVLYHEELYRVGFAFASP